MAVLSNKPEALELPTPGWEHFKNGFQSAYTKVENAFLKAGKYSVEQILEGNSQALKNAEKWSNHRTQEDIKAVVADFSGTRLLFRRSPRDDAAEVCGIKPQQLPSVADIKVIEAHLWQPIRDWWESVCL